MSEPTWKSVVQARLKALEEVSAECWVCSESTTHWGILVPETKEGVVGGDMGFGEPEDKNKTRVVFFPICKTHNWEDPTIQRVVMSRVGPKSSALKN